jgi:ATP-dependent Clp protease ATP-binding subunit ClpA
MTGLYPDAPEAGDVPFSDAAGRLLAAARGESNRLGREYIGTEHVVLALTRDADGAALLSCLGVEPEPVRAAVEAIVKPAHSALLRGAERPYTSRTRQAFALAESARAQGQAGVGAEHLVVGLLRERMNLGALVLQEHGLSVERATAEAQRRRARSVVTNAGGFGAPPPGTARQPGPREAPANESLQLTEPRNVQHRRHRSRLRLRS